MFVNGDKFAADRDDDIVLKEDNDNSVLMVEDRTKMSVM